MAITDPFREIERMFHDDDYFFPAVRRTFGPPMDVYQTDSDVVVELQLPKIDPKNVKISIEEGTLRIEGREQQEQEEKGKDYYRREIRSGSFTRMISLPVPVKEDEVEATYENGILRIRMPKVEAKKKPKNVEVKINNK
jgi:HSP20 family protein